jgi:predicted MFS family arabinose efflux permease
MSAQLSAGLSPGSSQEPPPIFTKAYKRYALGILTLVNTLNYLDGFVIVLLLQPIKEDLHLSDTQLGFVTGAAFALFYATLGIPIARWSDRGNRSTITAVAIGLWSLTVMSSLLVRNFTQLVLARVAAGVGESGCMPPTYSLLGEYFPGPAERARAMSVYWLASPLSSVIGFVAGGWMYQRYGWRMTFFLIGLPGLLIAILVKGTVAEPRRQTNHSQGGNHRLPRLIDVLSTLWRQGSSRHLALAIILLWTMGSGMTPWYAAFMIRSHGITTTEAGNWLGPIFGLSGLVGILCGGYVASRWFARDEGAQMRISAVMIALLVPFFALFLLLPKTHQALLALVPLVVVNGFFIGPAFTLMQRLVADEMRATTLSVVMLFANLVGGGVGPQIVGILSDTLHPKFGADSLRYAMLALSFVALWSAYHFWHVGKTVHKDLSDLAGHPNSTDAAALPEISARSVGLAKEPPCC